MLPGPREDKGPVKNKFHFTVSKRKKKKKNHININYSYSERQEAKKVHADIWITSSPNVNEHRSERVAKEKKIDKPGAKL